MNTEQVHYFFSIPVILLLTVSPITLASHPVPGTIEAEGYAEIMGGPASTPSIIMETPSTPSCTPVAGRTYAHFQDGDQVWGILAYEIDVEKSGLYDLRLECRIASDDHGAVYIKVGREGYGEPSHLSGMRWIEGQQGDWRSLLIPSLYLESGEQILWIEIPGRTALFVPPEPTPISTPTPIQTPCPDLLPQRISSPTAIPTPDHFDCVIPISPEVNDCSCGNWDLDYLRFDLVTTIPSIQVSSNRILYATGESVPLESTVEIEEPFPMGGSRGRWESIPMKPDSLSIDDIHAPSTHATIHEIGYYKLQHTMDYHDRSDEDRPYGVCAYLSWDWCYRSKWERQCALEKIREMGAQIVRMEFRWDHIQSFDFDTYEPGEFRWESYEEVVEECVAYDLEILALISWSTFWNTTGLDIRVMQNRLNTCWDEGDEDRENPYNYWPCWAYWPPARFEEYGDFVEELASTFGEHIHYYEIWNEPNLWKYWRPSAQLLSSWGECCLECTEVCGLDGGGPDPMEFLLLFHEASSRIRSVDPDCVMVAGFSDDGLNGYEGQQKENFLRELYGLDGIAETEATFAQLVDVIALHIYDWGYSRMDRMFQDIRDARAVVQLNDPQAQLWIGECGVSTYYKQSSCPEAPWFIPYSESDKANLLGTLYHSLFAPGSEFGYLDRAFWYCFREKHPLGKYQSEGLELVDVNMTPLPAYWAYKSLKAADQLEIRCKQVYEGDDPCSLPNDRIEAEYFDEGGEGAGYHDTSGGNSGGGFRAEEDVDVCFDAKEGLYCKQSPGEWLEYGVCIPESCSTFLTIRVKRDSHPFSPPSSIRVQIRDLRDQIVFEIPAIVLPDATTWTTYQVPISIDLPELPLGALRIEAIDGPCQINYLEFSGREES